MLSKETPTDLQKEIDRNRPQCSECKPIYVDLSDTLCGCVGITYLHKCRDVLVEARILCKGCRKQIWGAS